MVGGHALELNSRGNPAQSTNPPQRDGTAREPGSHDEAWTRLFCKYLHRRPRAWASLECEVASEHQDLEALQLPETELLPSW